MQVGISEWRKHLRRYLANVAAGEELVITRRGRPVARLVPFNSVPLSDEEEEKRLLDLQRRGIIRLGTGRLPDDFWTMERVNDPEGKVLAALLAEREEGW